MIDVSEAVQRSKAQIAASRILIDQSNALTVKIRKRIDAETHRFQNSENGWRAVKPAPRNA